MNDTNVQATEEKRPVRQRAVKDDKSSHFGWGVFFVLAGLALFAKEMGWISLRLSWLLPAILIAIGCGYLYEAFKKKN
jgi:hypothetical protein